MLYPAQSSVRSFAVILKQVPVELTSLVRFVLLVRVPQALTAATMVTLSEIAVAPSTLRSLGVMLSCHTSPRDVSSEEMTWVVLRDSKRICSALSERL